MLSVIQMENKSFGDLRNTLVKDRISNLQQVGGKKRNLNSKNKNSSEKTAGHEPVKKTKIGPKRGVCSGIPGNGKPDPRQCTVSTTNRMRKL